MIVCVKLRSTVLLVSGGASGLGAAVVRHAVAAGARVASLDVHEPSAASEDGQVLTLTADVTSPPAVEAAVDETTAHFGRIDVLVNCAGVAAYADTLSTELDMFPLDVFRRNVEVNLIGTFDVVRHVAR